MTTVIEAFYAHAPRIVWQGAGLAVLLTLLIALPTLIWLGQLRLFKWLTVKNNEPPRA